MKVNTGSGMKPNSFRPIPEPRSASPESPAQSESSPEVLFRCKDSKRGSDGHLRDNHIRRTDAHFMSLRRSRAS